MKDPELRAAEEELRGAQKKAQTALFKSWETQGPAFRYRLLAFLAALQWGLVINMILLQLRHVVMPRTFANGYKAEIGLNWIPFTLILLAPLALVLIRVRWAKHFTVELVLGTLVGFALMGYSILR